MCVTRLWGPPNVSVWMTEKTFSTRYPRLYRSATAFRLLRPLYGIINGQVRDKNGSAFDQSSDLLPSLLPSFGVANVDDRIHVQPDVIREGLKLLVITGIAHDTPRYRT